MPPRRGRVISMVDNGGMWRESRVAVEEVIGRCFPQWTRRREAGGREVRRDRSCRRVGMVVEDGMCRGIAKKFIRGVYSQDVVLGGCRTFSR